MKIRKLKIKNYKVFDDIELDFTDKEGKTLDTIVLAGVNGSGKTTLLELFTNLFSMKRYQQSIYDCHGMNSYDFFDITKGNAFEIINCDEIQVELEISTETKIRMINIVKDEYNKMSAMSQRYSCTLEQLDFLIKFLETSNDILNLTYKTMRKNENSLKIEINHFILFTFIGSREYLINSRLCYIPSETYLNNSLNYTPNETQVENSILEQNDGIISHINFDIHKYIVEKYIFKLITQTLSKNRDKSVGEVINDEIKNINEIISNTKLVTKLIDIDFKEEKPIFESPNHKRISIDNLSSGEKQLFYQAVYLNSLNLKESILMVDEPETSLHPTWQQEVLKLYQNIGDNNQVIIATHSPHVISSVKPENLFVFHINEEKIECFNARDRGLHTNGNEPNDVLDEIMGTPLRNFETQKRIDKLSEHLLYPENYDKPEIQTLINSLIEDLGKHDPFIMRLNHQLMMIKRKKSTQ